MCFCSGGCEKFFGDIIIRTSSHFIHLLQCGLLEINQFLQKCGSPLSLGAHQLTGVKAITAFHRALRNL